MNHGSIHRELLSYCDLCLVGTNLHVVRSCWLDGLADNYVLHCLSPGRWATLPSERFLTRRSHAESQQGPPRWYLTSTTIASHALSSSCRRWVFWAMQRRASVACDADERKISCQLIRCCIKKESMLYPTRHQISSEESLSPIRRERWSHVDAQMH